MSGSDRRERSLDRARSLWTTRNATTRRTASAAHGQGLVDVLDRAPSLSIGSMDAGVGDAGVRRSEFDLRLPATLQVRGRAVPGDCPTARQGKADALRDSELASEEQMFIRCGKRTPHGFLLYCLRLSRNTVFF